MQNIQDYTVLFLVWAASFLAARFIVSKSRSSYKLPPSPFRRPVIGHLHLLRPVPHQALHTLSRRYGPLLHLSFDSVPCVLASSPETAKEFLKTHEISFSNRPSTVAVHFAPYGPYWKFMKKICMTELLGGWTLDQFLPIREEEVETFLKVMLQKSQANEVVDVGQELTALANNIISRMTMSKRCSVTSDEAGEVRTLVDEVGDYIWFCKNVDIQGLGKRLQDVHLRLDAMMEGILKEHEQATNKNCDSGMCSKDLVDIPLDMMEDEKVEMRLSQDVHDRNSHISRGNTVGSRGAHQPSRQNKAREEIDSLTGNKRLVKKSDVPNPHYLQAIVKETLRLHPSGPLFTRESTQHCKIRGYGIPANTRPIVNVWSIPQLLGKSNGLRAFEIHKWKWKEPNGLIQTTLAGLIQCFDWKVVNGKDNSVDMTKVAGTALLMAYLMQPALKTSLRKPNLGLHHYPLVCVPIARDIPFLMIESM
ncbi:hypothetical protein BT93_I1363 [Corymbia citriodora subsp. variegata]|nr:hypothetical protein BT93_I1363 [Corymbia citriodora subsp. variegata]